ncbi:ADP-ribose pyrophosphatase [Actinacidiphila alni]|uniref:ADP-ribose pyrophosphatase n=1 Tax=Actinacidiphila alni TaxID=380248 RepID=A0A1I2JCQ7_9ACTN|nr:NUDIX hydrolase [Actinacidiphila alni]SFF51770.1 ADP-ribose pyrophosphatase [Actinacidiphila alni]
MDGTDGIDLAEDGAQDSDGEADRVRERRRARLAAYDELRARRPELFTNPEGAAFEILLDPAEQAAVTRQTAELAAALGLSDDVADIGVVHQDPYIRLVRDAVRFADGRTGTYIRIVGDRATGGAAALPVLDDGRIVLLHHFRHADRRRHWEIPRGFGEAGEDGAATARREAGEELGCAVRESVLLGPYAADSGIGDNVNELHLVRIDTAAFREEPEDGARAEGISERRALDPGAFHAMLLGGEITDGYTLAAYGLAVARGLLAPPGR